jgi:HK97 family phage portal protein
MVMTAVDAQLIDQLKWTSENICACFHVPGYMVGIGPAPPYTDIQSINLKYYTQALQNPIENIELLLEEGLAIPSGYGIEFDLDALARMDSKTQMEMATKGVGGSIFSPNEGRA